MAKGWIIRRMEELERKSKHWPRWLKDMEIRPDDRPIGDNMGAFENQIYENETFHTLVDLYKQALKERQEALEKADNLETYVAILFSEILTGGTGWVVMDTADDRKKSMDEALEWIRDARLEMEKAEKVRELVARLWGSEILRKLKP